MQKNRLSVPAGNFRQRQMKKKKGLGEVTEEDEIRKWIGGRWTLKSAQKLLKKYGTLHEGEPIQFSGKANQQINTMKNTKLTDLNRSAKTVPAC